MPSQSPPFSDHPRCTVTGEPRHVGVEIELAGLGVEALSSLVAASVDGRVERLSRYEHRIIGDARGDWGVELDFAFLKRRGRRSGNDGVPEDALEAMIRLGAEQLVPVEVVSPPLPIDELGGVDRLIESLRRAGARGTGDGLTYAFGLQLNPELPALDATTVTRYLQAFLCLHDWLKERARVDLTRRLTAYIDPFPRDYVRRVIDPGYTPGLATLADDYLAANPTRNRALDLLPLLAHIDGERVRAAVDDPRIKPRPALHYRLPNSEVGRPGWGIMAAWADWLAVERLAADPSRLAGVCTAYAEHLDQPLSGLVHPWSEQAGTWLDVPDAP